eukprot:CAMPEP_0169207360 /NCGR_PEP_ID=MMETSP1016-20121227/13548_1 /TAXON_ID=342587 /ORGANISM="Karlodinium micrum, Strain CCMP2283" /LENGTH=91 /DNA_ID=CAMNT_0009284645 /DNA_START=83 /DNA_END=355 /DNA_ORIENTATION=+
MGRCLLDCACLATLVPEQASSSSDPCCALDAIEQDHYQDSVALRGSAPTCLHQDAQQFDRPFQHPDARSRAHRISGTLYTSASASDPDLET